MPRTILTSKGQITVPQEVRRALQLEMGDQLLIETTPTGFAATVIRKPTAAGLQGLLSGPVKFSSDVAERQAVADDLSAKHRH